MSNALRKNATTLASGPQLLRELTAFDFPEHLSFQAARQRAAEIEEKTVGKNRREQILKIAQDARKQGQTELVVELLQNRVRTRNRSQGRSMDLLCQQERIEYGAALAAHGAWQEALYHLSGVERNRFPQVELEMAIVEFRRWNWGAAEIRLAWFLTASTPATPGYLEARVRRAYAVMNGRCNVPLAESMFQDLDQDRRYSEHSLLKLEIVQGVLQTALLGSHWSEAERMLPRFVEMARRQGVLEMQFQAELLGVALVAAQGAPSELVAAKFDEIRARIAAAERWERLRLADYYSARYARSRDCASRLYFGTPYPYCREKILKFVSPHLATVSHYVWAPAQKGPEDQPEHILDFLEGSIDGEKKEWLEPGKAPRRLLEILSSDFYRPFSMISLHDALYPKQRFVDDLSPGRIRQLLKRLREHLASDFSGLALLEDDSTYRLKFSHGYGIRKPRPGAEASADLFDERLARYLKGIREGIGARLFSASEAAKKLDVSQATINRYLALAVQEGLIEREGAGRSTRYRFPRVETFTDAE
jgi:hypothetical protein